MLKDRRSAAMKVVEGLTAAEDAIDAALACAAELNAILVKARIEAKVSAMVGQEAFETAASAFAALTRARRDIVETHKRLSDTKIQVGLRTISFGDEVPKPPSGAADVGHLQIVA
ncbi:MAG TPA: hypothetical protein VF759_17015 [Allosphingosinicella sp.]|jgi:hypothetical protein